MIKRGGQPEHEIIHAKYLLSAGVEDIWGWITPAGQERVRARVRWITKACGMGPNINVLECGCGTGIFTRHLAKTGANITAVDISEDFLSKAQELCQGKNVKFVQANLEDPSNLVDDFFDVICGVSVLHHLDLTKALPCLWTKLKAGARFAFSEPNLLNPINKYLIFSDDLRRRRKLGVSPSEMAFRPKELRSMFEDAGYVVYDLIHRDFLHPSVPPILIPVVKVGQFLVEHAPLMRCLSRSLWIHGMRP